MNGNNDAPGRPPFGEIRHLNWSSPAVLAILAAALGLVGNLIVAWINNENTRDIAERQLQTDLVRQATSTNGDLKLACDNLRLFIDTGLLKDPTSNIYNGICNTPVWGNPLVNQPKTQPGADPPSSPAPQAVNVAPRPPITPAMVTVTKTSSGDNDEFNVSSVVPEVQGIAVDTIKLYGMQVTGNQRANEVDYPPLTGSWNPGDHFSFKLSVPKARCDPAQGWYLTFCVGSQHVCYPSPNLLNMVGR